jgi:hypothetical protein
VGLHGEEIFTIEGLEAINSGKAPGAVTVRADCKMFRMKPRLDTPARSPTTATAESCSMSSAQFLSGKVPESWVVERQGPVAEDRPVVQLTAYRHLVLKLRSQQLLHRSTHAPSLSLSSHPRVFDVGGAGAGLAGPLAGGVHDR